MFIPRTPIIRRWSLRILAALCLVLAVVTAALWARSYRLEERFMLVDRAATGAGAFRERSIAVETISGFVFIYYDASRYSGQPHDWPSYRGPEYLSWEARPGPVVRGSFYGSAGWWSRRGFGINRQRAVTEKADIDWRAITLPAWLVVLLGCLPAVVLGWRGIARRRTRSGLCSTCGYDLRATPERCPECGESVAGSELRVER